MSHIEEADQSLTAMRLKLSKIEQLLAAAKESLSRRRETSLAYTHLQMTTMWLGKTKGSLGIKSPYPASFDPNSAVIEKRADTVEIKNEQDIAEFGITEANADEVSVVKALRAALNKIEGEIWSMVGTMNDKPKFQLCINEAYVNCCNTTMWLGMTLNEVKKEQDRIAEEEARVAAFETEKDDLPPTPDEVVTSETSASDVPAPVTETPVVDMSAPATPETPVSDGAAPITETPVVDMPAPIVAPETPVVDASAPKSGENTEKGPKAPKGRTPKPKG